MYFYYLYVYLGIVKKKTTNIKYTLKYQKFISVEVIELSGFFYRCLNTGPEDKLIVNMAYGNNT